MIFHRNTAHHILLNDTSQHCVAGWPHRADLALGRVEPRTVIKNGVSALPEPIGCLRLPWKRRRGAGRSAMVRGLLI